MPGQASMSHQSPNQASSSSAPVKIYEQPHEGVPEHSYKHDQGKWQKVHHPYHAQSVDIMPQWKAYSSSADDEPMSTSGADGPYSGKGDIDEVDVKWVKVEKTTHAESDRNARVQ